jgi:hypothetical protein
MLARELERECNHDDVSKVCHSVDTKLGSFSFIQQYLNNWLVCSYHYQIGRGAPILEKALRLVA